MRIACLSAFPPGPASAGLNLSLIPLSQAVQELNHTLALFVPTHDSKFVRLSLKSEEEWTTSSPRFRGMPTEIRDAALAALTKFSERLIPPIFRLKDIPIAMDISWEAMGPFDAVMAYKPYFRSVTPCLRLAKRASVPSVLWFDDFDVDPGARVLTMFDLVICNSSEIANKFRSRRMLYLPHIIDMGQLNPNGNTSVGGPPGGIVILFPSTGFSAKQADIIIESSLAGGAGLPLYVVNSPPDTHHAPRGRSPREGLTLLPHLPRLDLLGLISRQAIAIVPQPDNAYGISKASGRLLECLALGIPSIVPNFGESKSIVEEGPCGLVYDHEDPSTIACAIRNLRDSPQLRARMGNAARRVTLSRGTWPGHAKAFVAAVQELISERTRTDRPQNG